MELDGVAVEIVLLTGPATKGCFESGILEGLLSSGIRNHFCLTSLRDVLRVRFLGRVDLEMALLCICSYHSL